MSEGERLTLDYLENAFRDAGLEPMFGDSYRQPVALVSIEADPDTAMTVTGGTGDAATLAYGADTVYGTGQAVAETGLEDSELVWVGYGIVAPEFGWNDYEGLDMEGKTAVILVNDDQLLDAWVRWNESPWESDEETIAINEFFMRLTTLLYEAVASE